MQNELFDLGADLSVPLEQEGRLRATQEQVDGSRRDCDRFNAELPELTSFVLPGGGETAARLHVARTICRRAEREALVAANAHAVNPLVLVYLNRLSDLLFILARAANARREPRGAALEAWELALAFAAAFVAGYVGSMLGLVLGTLRLPFIVLATGSPLAAAGTNIAISAAAAGAGGLRHAREGRVDWRVVAWIAFPSVAGAVAGALLADDVSESLLYGLIAAVLLWSGIDLALRPIAARPRARLRLGRRHCALVLHRPPRRCGRRHPRHAAHAGARSGRSAWTSVAPRERTSS